MSVELAPVGRRAPMTAPREVNEASRIAGFEPSDLAERFGTPLYVYDLGVVDEQVRALRAALPAGAELAYAVKANPSLAILAHLGAAGIGADVASGGELEATRRVGIPGDRIVMTGPGKRDDELRAAVRAGIRAITVESVTELARLDSIVTAEGVRQPILLRVAVASGDRLERIRLVGDAGAGKFGMDADDLRSAGRRALDSPHLELLGIHAFGASNVLDADGLLAHVSATVAIARQLASDIGFELRLIDAGGGLGIPYEPDQAPLDLHRLGRGLEAITAAWPRDEYLAGARLLMEPGRFLVGRAGTYVCRVVDRKTVGGSAVAILDGGIHHLLRPALVGQAHRIRAFGRAGTRSGDGDRDEDGAGSLPRSSSRVTIAGPLCSGLDVLARDVPIPPPEIGDLIAVLDAGAYGFTESMPLFLSHPIPAEVAVRDGQAALVRPRIEPSRWLDEQIVPAWSAGV